MPHIAPLAGPDPSRRLAPGIAAAGTIAGAAWLAAPVAALPPIVVALILGLLAGGVARRLGIEPGLAWCVKRGLRIAIALLGLRIALPDLWALGPSTLLLVVLSMAATLAAGLGLARLLGLEAGYGALAGAATAVCGASAALATATVVPSYPRKAADVALVVMAANAVSTLVMVLYPPLCAALGLDARLTGILLGATIHDVAQVAGAGYAVSESVGNVAVLVKLARVLLLLPVVVALGWWLARRGGEAGEARVAPPLFALAFIALCLLNSVVPSFPALMPLYEPLRDALSALSTVGLLMAIAALGLGTSLGSILATGWRHLALFGATTALLLALVLAGLLVLS